MLWLKIPASKPTTQTSMESTDLKEAVKEASTKPIMLSSKEQTNRPTLRELSTWLPTSENNRTSCWETNLQRMRREFWDKITLSNPTHLLALAAMFQTAELPERSTGLAKDQLRERQSLRKNKDWYRREWRSRKPVVSTCRLPNLNMKRTEQQLKSPSLTCLWRFPKEWDTTLSLADSKTGLESVFHA